MKTNKILIAIFIVLSTMYLQASSISFQMENDFIFHSDNDYSNGVRLEYEDNDNWKVFYGQHIYTPTSVKHPERGGSPYAGWSYLGFGYTMLQQLNEPIYYVGYYEVLGGIVGKSSGAEWTQKTIHKLVGASYPKGWESQLEDDFGFQLNVKQGLDCTFWSNNKYSAHFCPDLVVLAGSTEDAYGIDCVIKFGYGVPLTKSDSEFLARCINANNNFSIYGLAGAEWRYWKNRLFLDGDDSKEIFVEKKDNTWAVKAGIAGTYKNFGMRFIYLWGSNEYDGQRDRPNYVSMSFSYLF